LYYKSIFGGFVNVYPSYIKSLPIPATISDDLQAAIEKNVNLILASHKNFSTQHQTFMKVLESQFKIQKATEKIHDWYNLAFADFVAEIKKSKGKITSKQEFEWVTIFDEQKQNANKLMNLYFKFMLFRARK
jgi:hypothetical protein